MENRYDLIVIGCGPGGLAAAVRAGAMGKSVLVVEKSLPGGICLNEGCIPTKPLLHSAKCYISGKKGENHEVFCKDIRDVIFPHPTVSEIMRDAVWEMDL